MKYKTYSLDRDMSGAQVRKDRKVQDYITFNENLQSSLKQTGVQGVSNKSVQLFRKLNNCRCTQVAKQPGIQGKLGKTCNC